MKCFYQQSKAFWIALAIECLRDGKATKSNDGNTAELPHDEDDALVTKQQTIKDEQLLVNRKCESLEYANRWLLLVQKAIVAWALGGLGVLLYLVVVLVI